MIINRKNILSPGISDLYIFDILARTLLNPGALKEDSISGKPTPYTVKLHDGTAHQSGTNGEFEAVLLETGGTRPADYDGIMGRGCHIWLVSDAQTSIIRETDFTINTNGALSRKNANEAKIAWSVSGRKATDVCWQMAGWYNPENLILLVNPAVQKYSAGTSTADCSPFGRNIVTSGYGSAGALWSPDGVSHSFDGVNDAISIADSEFRGAEMIGLLDANTRTFESGTGAWVTMSGANTLTTTPTGGDTGSSLKLLIGAGSTQNLLSLRSDVQNLVAGQSYHCEARVKYDTAWNGGALLLQIGGYTFDQVLSSSYATFGFDFVATTVNPLLEIKSKTAPSAGDILRVDNISLIPISAITFHSGERIIQWYNRSFEGGTIGDWTAAGNHTTAFSASGYNSSTGALKITSSGVGSQSTNNASLAAVRFVALQPTKKYCIQFMAKIGTAGINLATGLGGSGQTAMFIGLSTTVWTKCVWKVTAAGINDVGQALRCWLSGTDATGTLIDDISITECVDFTASVWFKKMYGTGAINYLLGTSLSPVSAASGFDIRTRDDQANKLQMRVGDEVSAVSIDSPADVSDGQYHHAVLTYDATGNLTMYLDGAAVATGSTATVGRIGSITGQKVSIGGMGTAMFTGQLGASWVKRGVVWSADEVSKHYNSTKAVYGL